jgi:hypothetical protein
MNDYAEEDVGNIFLLEHVNVQVPDQLLATLFYVVGLGFTRDPYLNFGLNNMWVNVGEQQFHLPTRPAQVIQGHIGLVVPDVQALQERLASVEEGLRGTRFAWAKQEDAVEARCPWGNNFRCYAPDSRFGDMRLGMPYVEFLVPLHAAEAIVNFYTEVLNAPARVEIAGGDKVGRVKIGRHQALLFREARAPLAAYDGHHVAIYVANFSRAYNFLQERRLITEEVRNHQFRFKDILDLDSGKPVFFLEHEVRSLRHPMFGRFFVNRNPGQSQRAYKRGRDALHPSVS